MNPNEPISPSTRPHEAVLIEAAVRFGQNVQAAPANPVRRQQVFLESACRLLQGHAGVSSIFRISTAGDVQPLGCVSIGWTTPTHQQYASSVLRPLQPEDPLAPMVLTHVRADHSAGGWIRSEAFTDAHWSASTMAPIAAELGIHDIARSVIRLPDSPGPPRHLFAMADVFRAADQPAWTRWQLDLLQAVHRACNWIYNDYSAGHPLPANALSPREQETLTHLLAGASEKEVAARIGRSRHTVHSYVKKIYRQFGVTSRAELLSIFVGPGL